MWFPKAMDLVLKNPALERGKKKLIYYKERNIRFRNLNIEMTQIYIRISQQSTILCLSHISHTERSILIMITSPRVLPSSELKSTLLCRIEKSI